MTVNLKLPKLILSDRLLAISEFIEHGESLADIGTDHGQLPIYLLQKRICPKVILCDVKIGPIQKAMQNISIYAPETDFDIRIGDGLSPIEIGEVDCVVIAGMGGLLIISILGADLIKTRSVNKLVLQPRRDKSLLSKWLMENGFTIVDETLVREGKGISEILVTRPMAGSEAPVLAESAFNELDYEINPILFRKDQDLLRDFIERKIKIEEGISASIKSAAYQKSSHGKLIKSDERLSRLKLLISKLEKKE